MSERDALKLVITQEEERPTQYRANGGHAIATQPSHDCRMNGNETRRLGRLRVDVHKRKNNLLNIAQMEGLRSLHNQPTTLGRMATNLAGWGGHVTDRDKLSSAGKSAYIEQRDVRVDDRHTS